MSVKPQLLFVQGGGQGTHDEWDNKLVDSLQSELGQDYEIRYPRMPNEDDPDYAAWKTALQQEFQALQDGAILVAHSVGGTIVVKLLSEQLPTPRFGAVFLIAAPFVGEGGWASDDPLPSDLAARLPKDVPIHFYHGLEDEIAPPAHVDLYARAVPQARIHHLQHRDHQLNNDLREVAAAISSINAGIRAGTLRRSSLGPQRRCRCS
jgi:hypothetical protein